MQTPKTFSLEIENIAKDMKMSHMDAVLYYCEKNDLGCRRRQRQAILQWAYNPFI